MSLCVQAIGMTKSMVRGGCKRGGVYDGVNSSPSSISGECPSQSSIHAALKGDAHLRSEISGHSFTDARLGLPQAAWWPLGRRAGAGFFGRPPLLIRFGMQHYFIKVHDALMVTNQRLRPLALVPLWMDGASGAGQFRAGEAAKCACQTGWVLKRAWWRRWKIHLIFHVEGPVKRDQRSTSPYPIEVETLQTKKCKRSRYFPCQKRGCFCGRRFNVATGYPLLWEMLE